MVIQSAIELLARDDLARKAAKEQTFAISTDKLAGIGRKRYTCMDKIIRKFPSQEGVAIFQMAAQFNGIVERIEWVVMVSSPKWENIRKRYN